MASNFIDDNPVGPGAQMGMNTIQPRDYIAEYATNDLIKTSRVDWVQDDWTAFDGTLDANGWITAPGTAGTANYAVFISESFAGMFPTGNYVLTWDGTGQDVSVVGTGTVALGTPTVNTNRIVYPVTSWGSGNIVYLKILNASTDVTNVQFCHEDYEGDCQIGDNNTFDPRYLTEARKFKGPRRVMNAYGANHKENRSTWAGRTPSTYRTWATKDTDGDATHAEMGWPIEALVQLQNELQLPMWYVINIEYTDDAVTSLCQYLAQNVDDGLKVILEPGNEVWNASLSPAYEFAQEQGLLDVAATRNVTLSGMADSDFDGLYIQSQRGELGATFDSTASTTHLFRRESGGTYYALYHSTVTGNWEAAEVSTDPDDWTNGVSVTTVKSETVTANDDTWTEDSTIGPDEADANVTYDSAYDNEIYPSWDWHAKRGAQMMDLAVAAFAAEGRGDNLVRFLGLQSGSTESKNALDMDVATVYGRDTPVLAYTKFDAAGPGFYVGGKMLAEPQYSNNGAADDAAGSLKEGATMNTINMTDQECFDYANQICDTWQQSVGNQWSWAWWKNEIVTLRGLEMWGYEGGPHMYRTGISQTTRTDEIIDLFYNDSRTSDLFHNIVATASQYFNVLCWFTWVDSQDAANGGWGVPTSYALSEDYDNNPRLEGFGEAVGLRATRSI